MEVVRNYLVAVTAAAIICGIAKSIGHEKPVLGTVIRLIAGLIMTVTVLSPVLKLNLGELPDITSGLIADGKQLASQGENLAREQLSTLIKDQMQAYILDKAASFGVALEVEILMPDDGSAQAKGVILRGRVSPYARMRLQEIIAQDLNIAKENQQWIG